MMDQVSHILCFAIAWIGHACIAVYLLNNLYARPYPKVILKPFRLFVGLLILAFPIAVWALLAETTNDSESGERPFAIAMAFMPYLSICLLFGGVIFPLITLARLLRTPPSALLAEKTETLDLWPLFGRELFGNGKWKWMPRLPGNGVLKVDFTELTLALPNLPPEWEGLTFLHLSDLHLHGTPSRKYFDEVFARIASGPTPDVIVLNGDYVDTDTHHEWLRELLGPLRWNECGFAVLGNHDDHHDPEQIRKDLSALGYRVLGNGWQKLTIRGVECVAIGHEGPWFTPPPDVAYLPANLFRLCVSHTPDNFYWGVANRVGLMFCGHVHGGQVRLPVIGSIFVPSKYSRRFDMGVFEGDSTVMVATRGLSGKEPLRFRCNPQVIRITLKCKTQGK